MDQIKIGKLIAKQRKEKGLTQQELGDKVGVGYRAVSKWETGQTLPDISIINELSKTLGITADELLKGELNKHKETNNHSKNKLLLLLIPLFIIAIVIMFIYERDNKAYKYELKSADFAEYQVEGNLMIKNNVVTIKINKVWFNDYNFCKTEIKNYEYQLRSNEKTLVGVGYNSISNNISKQMPTSEVFSTFKVYYHDRLSIPREELESNNMVLEFNFVDSENNIINKKIEILLIAVENSDKSTN